MNNKLFHGLTIIGLAGLLSMNLLLAPSTAQSSTGSGESLRQGLPGRRVGGGTRCTQGTVCHAQKPLVAIMPQSNLAVTTEAYPTLLFHLPVFENEQQVEFVLYNSADELVYDATFDIVGESGITGIDLSEAENLAPLAVDETYKWYFLIVSEERSQDIVVDGWIQRVDLDEWVQQQEIASDFGSRLEDAASLQRFGLLGEEAGLWHDAAFALHQLRQVEPDNEEVAAEWAQLLQAMDLGDMEEEPVANLSFIPIMNETL